MMYAKPEEQKCSSSILLQIISLAPLQLNVNVDKLSPVINLCSEMCTRVPYHNYSGLEYKENILWICAAEQFYVNFYLQYLLGQKTKQKTIQTHLRI